MNIQSIMEYVRVYNNPINPHILNNVKLPDEVYDTLQKIIENEGYKKKWIKELGGKLFVKQIKGSFGKYPSPNEKLKTDKEYMDTYFFTYNAMKDIQSKVDATANVNSFAFIVLFGKYWYIFGCADGKSNRMTFDEHNMRKQQVYGGEALRYVWVVKNNRPPLGSQTLWIISNDDLINKHDKLDYTQLQTYLNVRGRAYYGLTYYLYNDGRKPIQSFEPTHKTQNKAITQPLSRTFTYKESKDEITD